MMHSGPHFTAVSSRSTLQIIFLSLSLHVGGVSPTPHSTHISRAILILPIHIINKASTSHSLVDRPPRSQSYKRCKSPRNDTWKRYIAQASVSSAIIILNQDYAQNEYRDFHEGLHEPISLYRLYNLHITYYILCRFN